MQRTEEEKKKKMEEKKKKMEEKRKEEEGKKKDIPLTLGDLDRLNLTESDIALFAAKRRRKGEAEEPEESRSRRKEICTVLGIGSSSTALLSLIILSSIDGYPKPADCDD